MAQRRSKNRKSAIKDYMDTILESKSFYRKHVAADGQAIERSISDVIFGTQKYKEIVADAISIIVHETKNDEERRRLRFENYPQYPLICKLAQRFNFEVEIISATDEALAPFNYQPKRRQRRKKE